MAKIVAITGRPNVGKSTLFNRLVEERAAVTHDSAGVTRDRHYEKAEWNGQVFTLIDTGGYVHGSDDIFESAIRDQVKIAVEEASVILFLTDCQAGLTGLDKDFANVLRRGDKPVIVAVNKSDDAAKSHLIGEFYAMGLEEVYPVSAQSGFGTGDLLDRIVELLPKDEEVVEDAPKIAVLGRPNAGKSSFVNVVTEQNRAIVTDVAGTTRDSINTRFTAFGHDLIMIDTAGLRRKSRVNEDIEFYSVMRTIKAVEDTDVCIIMVDAERGLEGQDLNIIHLAQKNVKGIVLAINKWDLIEKDESTARKMEKEIRESLSPNDHIPIVFTSVTKKQRLLKVLEKAVEVYENKSRMIKTSELNETLLPEIERYPPPAYRAKHIKIKYITQISASTPTFLFFCNHPDHIREPYKRFLENKLRKYFKFEGVSIRIFFRKK